jgi:hypothetical protein
MDFDSESKLKEANDVENLDIIKRLSFDKQNIIKDFDNIKREEIVRILIKLNI